MTKEEQNNHATVTPTMYEEMVKACSRASKTKESFVVREMF